MPESGYTKKYLCGYFNRVKIRYNKKREDTLASYQQERKKDRGV